MARMTIGQKASRVVQLILALRNRRIAAKLVQHGFTKDELERGWTLVTALTRGRLVAADDPDDPKLLVELDAWENKWFPIVSAALQHRFPEAHEHVFRNLSQTTGPEVAVTVGTLLERVEQLSKPREHGGLGREGKAARDLLTKRGFTSEVVAKGEEMLATIREIEPIPEDEGPSAEEQEQAEREMWAWYLEWSTIARTVITDRNHLRQLGFLQSAKRSEPATDPSVDGDDGDVEDPRPEQPTA